LRIKGTIAVTGWREAPFFTERERAALLWTESLTTDTSTSEAFLFPD
jgi:alkylhydroperoxidase family enzyme